MPVQTLLAGESLERAKHVLGLSTKLGDGASLLTPKNLERLGFFTTTMDVSPVDEGDTVARAPGSQGSILCNTRVTCIFYCLFHTCHVIYPTCTYISLPVFVDYCVCF